MTKKTIEKIRRIYGICLAAMSIVVGILLIVQAWSIFLSGEKNPYTVASVTIHFKKISPFVWGWVAMSLISVVLSIAFPDKKEKVAAYVDVKLTFKRLQARLPKTQDGMQEVEKQNFFQIVAWSVCAVLCVVAAVAIGWTLLETSYTPRFETEFFAGHGAVADRLVRILPWIFAALAVYACALYFEERSVKKQTELVKAKFVENAKQGVQAIKKEEKSTKTYFWQTKKFVFWVRIGICVVGVALFVVGIFNGGMADVYEKAKNICTQCIGLG